MDQYSIVVVAAVAALIIPTLALFLNWMLSPVSTKLPPSQSDRSGTRLGVAGTRTNTRILLAINISLVFLALGILILPGANAFLSFQQDGTPAELLKIKVALLSVIVSMVLAVFYVNRKGDLDWIRAFGGSGKDRRKRGSNPR